MAAAGRRTALVSFAGPDRSGIWVPRSGCPRRPDGGRHCWRSTGARTAATKPAMVDRTRAPPHLAQLKATARVSRRWSMTVMESTTRCRSVSHVAHQGCLPRGRCVVLRHHQTTSAGSGRLQENGLLNKSQKGCELQRFASGPSLPRVPSHCKARIMHRGHRGHRSRGSGGRFDGSSGCPLAARPQCPEELLDVAGDFLFLGHRQSNQLPHVGKVLADGRNSRNFNRLIGGATRTGPSSWRGCALPMADSRPQNNKTSPTPAAAAPTHAAIVPTPLRRARPVRPAWTSRTVSKLAVLNVVYPPRNPVPRIN